MSSSSMPISISSSTTRTRRLAAAPAGPVILLESFVVAEQAIVPAEPAGSNEPRSLSNASMIAPEVARANRAGRKKFHLRHPGPIADSRDWCAAEHCRLAAVVLGPTLTKGGPGYGLESRGRKLE